MTDSTLRLIVLARGQSARVQNAWKHISEFLESQPDTEVVASAVTEDFQLDTFEADLVLVLGGDGAILRACRLMGRRQLPIVGVNLGRLGFLADLTPDEFRSNFELIHQRKFSIVDHMMFECRIVHADGTHESYLGLNETAILASGSLSMLDVDLAIDGQRVTTYSCDGLIVSTPVGSTAHSLSAGGPILQQDMRAFVITPICPHTLTNRPVVDHADRVYSLSAADAPEGVAIVVDGQIKLPYQPGDVVEIREASVMFKLARLPGHNYYTTLNRKLGWAGQPIYRSDSNSI